MAVVGHAYVVVRAITDGVDNDIRRAFSGSRITNSAQSGGRTIGNALVRGIAAGTKDIDNSMTRAAKSFRTLYPEADSLRRAFVNSMRAGYLLQAGLGALVGTVSAVVGGLVSLIGAAGGAAASLVAVGSAALTARVGLGVAQYALGGVAAAVKSATNATGGYSDATKDLREQLQQLRFDQEEADIGVDRAAFNLEKARQNMLRTADLAPNSLIRRDAELAFREAELAYRRAKDNQEDLKDGLADDGSGGGGGSDPFANLTPSQRAFAEWLVGIQDIFKDLREAAASGFLPILQEQLQRLIDSPLLGILEARFFEIGQGAGNAVKNFVDIFLSGDNMRDFNEALGDMAEILPSFGTIAGNIFDSFLSIIVEADPLTRKFVGWLETKTGAFADFLNVRQATGELEAFFNRSGEIAANFGRVFGGVFGGLGDIIMANFGPGSGGDRLLIWLGDAAQGFANIDKVFLDNYFQGTADNFMAIGDALGGALESLIRAGSEPGIKAFWDALDGGSQAFDSLIQNFVNSSAAFGDVLRIVTQIVEVFSDSGQVETFFGTISFFLSGLKDILVGLRPVIDIVGPILAAVSAAGLLFAIGTKLALVFGSFVTSAVSGLGILTGATAAQTAATVAQTGAQIGLTTAYGSTTVAVKAADVATKSFMATNPIGWAMLVVSAIAAIGIAIASIRSSAVEKATKGVTKAFDEGTFSMETFQQTAETIGGGGFNNLISDAAVFKQSMGELETAQRSFGHAFLFATGASTTLADSFGAVGRSLANVAVTNLPKAQEGFKSMKKELGLNNRELVVALDEMDEFKDALVEQADQLGINVYDLEGNIDKNKLLALALGEGEYALRQQEEALKEQARQLAAVRAEQIANSAEWEKQSLAVTGWNSAISDAMKDGEFDLKAALGNMETSIEASTQLQKDMLVLKQKGLSEAALDMIRDTGAQAPALVEALLGASEAEFNKFDEMARQAAIQLSDTFNGAKTDLINSWADGKITDATFNALYDGLENVTDPAGLAKITGEIARELSKTKVVITPTVNTIPAKQHLKDLSYAFGVNIPGVQTRANGGFITGPGGPKSDLIPAMLSNGEYVVNAKSTSRYRGLLEKINSEGNKFADGGMVGSKGSSMGGINITVNPSPGMNEKELAAAVSRELAYQIRKGSI